MLYGFRCETTSGRRLPDGGPAWPNPRGEPAMTENQTRAEKLAGQISNAILAGEFVPGSRLDEQQLAQRFGVSRTPVREALRQLATSGLIDLRPRRGALGAR